MDLYTALTILVGLVIAIIIIKVVAAIIISVWAYKQTRR